MNAHRSSEHTHTLLQTDDSFDILLIQEPWVSPVATLRSDTDPEGSAQTGATFNNKWDAHLPNHRITKDVKAIAYSRRGLGDAHVIVNNTAHPLSTPTSIILDIMEGQEILLRIVNVYHTVNKGCHTLQHLFDHRLDDLTPTLLIGDFNTHSHRWSMPGKCPDPWADAFGDWMDENGLTLQNPDLTPT